MRIIPVSLKECPYDIIIGNNIIAGLGKYLDHLKIGKDAYIITNKAIKNRHASALVASLKRAGFAIKFKLVPDTEKSKSLSTAFAILKELLTYGQGKKVFVVAFGGGVIGDLAGFIASLYKRGIAYIQVPTTLLAQVDSAIGGKTAVDLAQGKNLIGLIYQPRLVYSDIKFLNTLPKRQRVAGLAEVIKYALIKDRELFNYLEKNYSRLLKGEAASLKFIVERSSKIKAKVVAADEKEKRGIRTILNFGHTIGHALEAAGGYRKYNHGEAVSLGMLVAAEISRQMGLINRAVLARIENLIKAAGLPTTIKRVALDSILRPHYQDKKFIGRKNRFVLIRGIGKTKIVENIPLKIIKSAIRQRMEPLPGQSPGFPRGGILKRPILIRALKGAVCWPRSIKS